MGKAERWAIFAGCVGLLALVLLATLPAEHDGVIITLALAALAGALLEGGGKDSPSGGGRK